MDTQNSYRKRTGMQTTIGYAGIDIVRREKESRGIDAFWRISISSHGFAAGSKVCFAPVDCVS
jgi:hypothetical protein